jgi:Protein of unknown function (DUF3996)
MTAHKILFATFGLVVFTAAAADARPRPEGHLGGQRFEANKTFGLGIELGEPTSLNGKYFLSADRALDFGIGTIYNYFDRSGFHIYGDYLWHPVSLISNEAFELPLYVGIGGRLWSFEDRTDPNNHDNAFALGFRVPVGVSFDFNTVPIDIFVQVVPVLDFFSGYTRHSVYVDFDASIGVRYWFN